MSEKISKAYEAVEQGRFRDALDRFRHVADLGTDAPHIHRELAKTYHQFGRFTRAFDAYGRAAELFDADSKQHHVWEMLETMSRLQPEDISRQAKLAELLVKLGKEDRAVEKVEECAAGLLRERGDMASFLEVATRILELGSEHESMRRRIADIIVTESAAFVRYNLHGRAERLLRTILEYCPDYHDVREALVDVLLEEGKSSDGVRELIWLARHADIDPGDAEQLLKRACRHASERQRVESVAEEMGIDLSEVEWCGEEGSFSSGTAGLSAETDPAEESLDFQDVSTATDLSPISDLPDVPGHQSGPTDPPSPPESSEADATAGGDSEAAGSAVIRRPSSGSGTDVGETETSDSDSEVADEPNSPCWDDDAMELPEESRFLRLLALLWYAEDCTGCRVVRLRTSAGTEVARLAVQSGRLLPAMIVDGEVRVDGELERRDGDLAEALQQAEPDFGDVFEVLGAHWRPALRGPLRQMLARGLGELISRESAGGLTVESRVAEEGIDAHATFSGFSLLRIAADALQPSGGDAVRAFFEEVRGGESEAWILTREAGEVDAPLWLPVRVTARDTGILDGLDEISAAVSKLVNLAETVRGATESGYPIVSSVIDEWSKWVFLQTRAHVVCVRIHGNRLGTVLNQAVAIADEFSGEAAKAASD